MSVLAPLAVAVFSLVVALLVSVGLLPESLPAAAFAAVSSTITITLFFLIQLLIVSPMLMWKEQHDKILGYETPTISIFYDDADQACKRDKHIGDNTLGDRLWRVGVKGTEGVFTKGVIVRLEKIEPSVTDLPLPLHPMKSRWEAMTWEGDGSFDVRPDATEYVDVIRYFPSHGQETGRLELVQQLDTSGKALPFRSHTLTLSAQGEEGPRVTRRFQLEVNPNNLTRFFPLDDLVTPPTPDTQHVPPKATV